MKEENNSQNNMANQKLWDLNGDFLDIEALADKESNKIADYTIETNSNANGYYEKRNSGILFQWGNRVGTAGQVNTIPFPISFIDNNYSIFGNAHRLDGIASTGNVVHFGDLLPNSARVSRRNSADTLTGDPYSWQAIGRWKD